MSRYYIDAELTSMIGACQEDVYEYEVYCQSFKLVLMHLCSPRIMKRFFADEIIIILLRTCDCYIYCLFPIRVHGMIDILFKLIFILKIHTQWWL